MLTRLKYLKNSNLFEYFYYFLLITLTIILVLGGSLYYYFSTILKNETIKTANNTLEQLKNSQEIILSEIDKSVANIVLDPNLINFMDYVLRRDDLSIIDTQNKISNIVITNEYIESLSIYYLENNTVLSSEQGVVKVDEFYDHAFLKSLDYKNIKWYDVKTRSKKVYFGDNDTTVISFIKSIPINYAGKLKAVVVVNLKGTYLKQMMDLIETDKYSNIMVTDNSGNLIAKKNDTNSSFIIDINKAIKTKKAENSEYFIKNIDNKKLFISKIYSEKYKWVYLYSTPMSSILSSIIFLRYVTLIFCFIMILISIVGSLIFSKRIYSPIKVLVSLINNNNDKFNIKKGEEVSSVDVITTNIDYLNNSEIKENQENNIQLKETALIEKNLNSLINTNNTLIKKNVSLEAQLYEFEIYKRDKFLKYLVEGTLEGDKKVCETLEYYKIDLFENGYYLAYVLSMDNYDDFQIKYSEKQQNMLFIYISECASTHIFSNYKGFIVEKNVDEVVIYVNFEKSMEKSAVKSISYNLANILHESIHQNMKYTFTIGVSSIHTGIENIHQCYKDAVSAANYRLLLGHNNVIFYDNINYEKEGNKSYPFFIESNILRCLKTGDSKGVLNSLEEFTGYLINNQGEDILYVRHYFLQLLSSTIKCIYDIDKNLSSISVTEKEVYSNILKMETMLEMKAYLENIYKMFLNYSDKQRNIKNNQLVTLITKYINENLTSDLSIDILAEKFFISSSHLRKIFKDEIGKTIKDYIEENRINKAKGLLKNANLKIYDISELVGFQSIQTFTRTFKACVGKSPGEYRTQFINELAPEDESIE